MSLLDSESEKAYYFSAKTEFLLREKQIMETFGFNYDKIYTFTKGFLYYIFYNENVTIA